MLKKNKLNILRGHAFKPLTFPYRSKQYLETKFEGLKWLDEVKKYLNLLIVTEVTEIKYLQRISYTADILQIGSRWLGCEGAGVSHILRVNFFSHR